MRFERAAWWGQAGFGYDARSASCDEDMVRREFWPKVKRLAAQIPFAEDLLAAYFCAFDRATPVQVKAALLGALAYFVLPFDAVPDMLLLIGLADDAAVLATALRMVTSHIKPEHHEAARRMLVRMKNAT